MRFLRVLLAIIIVLAAVYAVFALFARPAAQLAYFDQFAGGPLVMAHGGGQGLWPDNTVRAYEGSVALGADVLEIDVHQDASGEFWVMHDATVDRTTDGAGAIAAMSGAQLAALDNGYNWTVEGPRSETELAHQYRGQGIGIPKLTDVLQEFQGVAINIELKQDEGAAGVRLCDLLRTAGATDRVMVASFHTSPMKAFREACPEVATSATKSEVTLFFVLSTLGLGATYTPPFEALQVSVKQGSITVVTPRLIRAAHARNLPVQVWTVNDRAEMTRLLEMGVDGLITDRPDRALQATGRQYPAELVPSFVTP